MNHSASASLNHYLEFIVDRINVGVFVVDHEYRIHYWNQFMTSYSGQKAEQLLGKNLFEAFPEVPRSWFSKKVQSVFQLKAFGFTSWEQRPYLFQFRHNRPVTGGVDWMRQNSTLMPLKNEQGDVEFVCVTIQDATDACIYQTMLKEAMQKLELSSRTDGLTQIYNRMFWEASLNQELERRKRYGGQLSLLMFDLDHFKSINDTYGHLAGDEVLRSVAARLRSLLRNTDTPGRYGGEEFGLLLPGTGLEGAAHVAERLREVMAAEPVQFGELSIPISISLGITEANDQNLTNEQLIAEADMALYYSKSHGRNRWTAYHSDMTPGEH